MPTIAAVFIGVTVGVIAAVATFMYGQWEYHKGFRAGLGLRAAADYRQEQEERGHE